MPVSAALQAEWEKPNPTLRRRISFAFPDGNELMSDVALCSSSTGFHEARVKSWGKIPAYSGDRQNHLIVPEWTGFSLVDTDGKWRTRSSKQEIKNTLATVAWSSPLIEAGQEFARVFSIWDCKETQEALYSLTFRPPAMERLIKQFPTLPLTYEDFPNIPKDTAGLRIPIGPYGLGDSYGLGTIDGTILPPYVDTVNFWYLIGLNCVGLVRSVYRDGVRFAQQNWTQIYYETNGRVYTILQMDNDQSTKEITVDFEGYRENGDATGPFIGNPVVQMWHCLENSVYAVTLNSLRDGWAPTPPEISSLHWEEVADWVQVRTPAGYYGTIYVPAAEEPILPLDVINAGCASLEIVPFFTVDNQLAVEVDDVDADQYIDDPHVMRYRDELDREPLMPVQEARDVVGSVIVSSAQSEAAGSFQEKLEVVSQETTSDVIDKIAGEILPGYI